MNDQEQGIVKAWQQGLAAKDAEIVLLQALVSDANLEITELNSVISGGARAIERLRAALEVFASPESWDIVRRDYGNNAFINLRVFVQPMNPDGTDTIDYPAEFARKALEGTS